VVLRFRAAWQPYRTWFVLLPPIFVALWLGPVGWAVFVTLISAWSFREFARVTGLYQEPAFVILVYAAIAAANTTAFFGEAARQYFLVVPVWAIAALTLVPIVLNRTDRMLQWSALSIVGVLYFGFFLAHLTYMRASPFGIGSLIYVVLMTQVNDAMAFLFGKSFGRHRWTVLSPNKTIEGSLLALVASIALAFVSWPIAFPYLPWYGVVLAGAIVSIAGQVGDLTMANVKRNVGVKDFGSLLPGHGGILDRTNSLMLVAPVFMHVFNFFWGMYP
jgi:phosphatidate cytidylyltransferase